MGKGVIRARINKNGIAQKVVVYKLGKWNKKYSGIIVPVNMGKGVIRARINKNGIAQKVVVHKLGKWNKKYSGIIVPAKYAGRTAEQLRPFINDAKLEEILESKTGGGEPPSINKELIVSIGEYKGVKFDILLRMVVTKEEYKAKTEEQWIAKMKDIAINNLAENEQWGLRKMIQNNSNVKGLQAEDTAHEPSDFEFVRFIAHGSDILYEATHKRKSSYNKTLGEDDE